MWFKHRNEMYRHLKEATPVIFRQALNAVEAEGLLPPSGDGEIVGRDMVCSPDDLRHLTKKFYGEQYDALPVGSYPQALDLAYRTCFCPAENGRRNGVYITPWEKHARLGASFGTPFPPWYDRLIFGGKGRGRTVCPGLSTVPVPFPGASYGNHGCTYRPVPLLLGLEPQASLQLLTATSEAYVQNLVGYTSLGYDSPGYGHRFVEGVPPLLAGLGELSNEFGVPYILNCHRSLPFLGPNIAGAGAALAIYDLAFWFGPQAGSLIVGAEPVVTCLRENCPPVQGALLTVQCTVLNHLANNKGSFASALDRTHAIVLQEMEKAPPRFLAGTLVSISQALAAVEINYEGTWSVTGGFPIFTEEDERENVNPLVMSLKGMGLRSLHALDGSIYVSPVKKGTQLGFLSDDEIRRDVKALLIILQTIGRHSGFLEPTS